MAHLKQVLEAKLEEYNEAVASMNLVLFNQAMEHVSRIARIIDLDAGSALLVGVGGSGKQSLSKLTSYPKMNEVSLERDCFPEPPTPTRRALPASKSMILAILVICSIA
jgi:hypothetical protein